MMKMNGIKPCPFCGMGAVLECRRIDESPLMNSTTVYIVRCTHCMARTGEYADGITARERWNRRVNDG